MIKSFWTLVRGTVYAAEQEAVDRSALLVLDQHIRDAAAGIERAKRALAVAIAQDEAEGKRLDSTLSRIADLEDRAAAALAAGPGGMRSLRRCGRPVAAVAMAAESRAMTCPLSRTITPSPSAAIRCRAMTIPLLVAMSQNSPPTGWLTTTVAAASSGGTE